MQETIRTKWIVSKRFDLLFFICPVVMTPLLFLCYLAIKDGLDLPPTEASTLIYAFFLLLFDQAHIFQTFSRSHGDSIEFKRHKKRHIIAPLLIIGAGPLYWYLDFSDTIYFVFIYYGMWHIWRQNMGFLKVYRGLHKDYAPIDTKIDMSFYWLLFWASILPDLMEQIHTIIPILDVGEYADGARWVLYTLMILGTITFYARQLYRHHKKNGSEYPKGPLCHNDRCTLLLSLWSARFILCSHQLSLRRPRYSLSRYSVSRMDEHLSKTPLSRK